MDVSCASGPTCRNRPAANRSVPVDKVDCPRVGRHIEAPGDIVDLVERLVYQELHHVSGTDTLLTSKVGLGRAQFLTPGPRVDWWLCPVRSLAAPSGCRPYVGGAGVPEGGGGEEGVEVEVLGRYGAPE